MLKTVNCPYGYSRIANIIDDIPTKADPNRSEAWQHRYGHPILLVETCVDSERFEGIHYRAANWTEIGVTKGFGRWAWRLIGGFFFFSIGGRAA